jgi:glycosyltransferase involved in cell wall biosynthesis
MGTPRGGRSTQEPIFTLDHLSLTDSKQVSRKSAPRSPPALKLTHYRPNAYALKARAVSPPLPPRPSIAASHIMSTIAISPSEAHQKAGKLRTACIITHYNYGRFIFEAVRSALSQTRALDEIVVVDDGSQADDLAQVRAACQTDPRIRLVEQVNAGQLEAFTTGFLATSADLIFFLDADDIWEPTYIAAATEIYTQRADVDFIAANRRECYSDGRTHQSPNSDRDLGYSVVLCHQHPHWIGASTSCLSMRRSILKQILPFNAFKSYRICADECLVVGASLAGARKYSLGSIHVNYRIHASNAWHGRNYNPDFMLWRKIEGRRLCKAMRIKFGLPEDMSELALHEFRTIERPEWREFRLYNLLLLQSKLAWPSRLASQLSLLRSYLLGHKSNKRSVQS